MTSDPSSASVCRRSLLVKRSLTAKLDTVASLLAKQSSSEAIGILDDDFVGEVEDLSGSQLTDAMADELVGSAALIRSTILRSSL